MGKRPIVGVLSFGCAVLLTSSAWAATLEPAQGDLSVNQGQGFQPVNSRIDAKVGDSVMVGPGGTATLTYDDGCTVTVQPGSVTTIAPLSPCAAGSYAQGNNNQNGNNQNGNGQYGQNGNGQNGNGQYGQNGNGQYGGNGQNGDDGGSWGGLALGGAALGLTGFAIYEMAHKPGSGIPPVKPASAP